MLFIEFGGIEFKSQNRQKEKKEKKKIQKRQKTNFPKESRTEENNDHTRIMRKIQFGTPLRSPFRKIYGVLHSLKAKVFVFISLIICFASCKCIYHILASLHAKARIY